MSNFLKLQLPLAVFSALFLCYSCTSSENKYDINKYYSTTEQDSLKADIVTYIARKPKNLPPLSRFEPRYRKYYLQFLAQYHFDQYHITSDSTHFFYMLRPARSAKGNVQRGVGGKFRKNDNGRITDFEELFNTPVMEEEELKEKGRALFTEMIKTGDINTFAGKRSYVEWPDENSVYDKKTYEWRYVPNNQ